MLENKITEIFRLLWPESIAFLSGFGLCYLLVAWRSRWQIQKIQQQWANENSLWQERQSHQQSQIQDYKQQLAKMEEEIQEIRSDLRRETENRHQAQTQVASLQSQISHLQSQREVEERAVTNLKSTFQNVFQSLAADALQKNNQSFLDLARSTLNSYQENARGELEHKKKNIQNILHPLESALQTVNDRIKELEKERVSAYSSIKEQIRNLSSSQMELQKETQKLSQALRSPTVRGRWGEIQLQRVVEIAGMLEYCDFFQQKTTTTESGSLRPDMIIRLPNEKNIVVDSKAPLAAYLEAMESNEEKVRVEKLKEHAKHIRAHLNNLSSKSYWEQFQPTPEFAVLFLPGENFFSAALEQDPSLIEFGVERKIILATPTTLIALLRTVAHGWQQQQVTQNAKNISELGSLLYERIGNLSSHFGELRKNLDKSVETFNRAMGSFEGRVLVAARKFRELGASNGEVLDEFSPITRTTRNIQTEEENLLLFSDIYNEDEKKQPPDQENTFSEEREN